jgi:glyoxylase-like metal-dependent hydrolase (beta-lactamase superfamily II)
VAPGIVALEVDAICPEDTALHVEAGEGLLAFADGLIRSGDGSLAFVPDFLMGDDPGEVKRGLRDALRRLVELDFDSLLFAHGEPLVGGGKSALRAFVR